jgi:alpha-galactosidase
MMKLYIKILVATLLAILVHPRLFAQTDARTQLAPLPPMGWNSWNTFQTHIDETLLKKMADALVSSGMRDADYQYLVLDDGWMAMQRDANGNLVADPVKFPSGIKALADYVHDKGLKLGIYNCAGDKTCAGYPGSRGHEYQDARIYAAWGVDYLKYDWCNTDSLNAREAYITMSRALTATGRSIVFSLCEWGNHQPWLWAKGVGELYRTTGDITADFSRDKSQGSWTALSVLSILDKQAGLTSYNGPGHWNDPDMLEVGNGMSQIEDKAHFTMWCMLSAPLISGNDLTRMSPATNAILTNKAIIALDQDQLGLAATRVYNDGGIAIWIKPLAGNNLAVCFLNTAMTDKPVTYDWRTKQIKLSSGPSIIDFTTNNYTIQDLWTGKNIGNTQKTFRATLAPHDVIVLQLTK